MDNFHDQTVSTENTDNQIRLAFLQQINQLRMDREANRHIVCQQKFQKLIEENLELSMKLKEKEQQLSTAQYLFSKVKDQRDKLSKSLQLSESQWSLQQKNALASVNRVRELEKKIEMMEFQQKNRPELEIENQIKLGQFELNPAIQLQKNLKGYYELAGALQKQVDAKNGYIFQLEESLENANEQLGMKKHQLQQIIENTEEMEVKFQALKEKWEETSRGQEETWRMIQSIARKVKEYKK